MNLMKQFTVQPASLIVPTASAVFTASYPGLCIGSNLFDAEHNHSRVGARGMGDNKAWKLAETEHLIFPKDWHIEENGHLTKLTCARKMKAVGHMPMTHCCMLIAFPPYLRFAC